jgi:hypothetical protein
MVLFRRFSNVLTIQSCKKSTMFRMIMRSWKSHRFTLHTWLGLNPQIERPHSRIVVQLVFFLNLFKLRQKSPDKSQHRKGICNHDVHMLWKSQFSRPWWLRDRLWSSLDRARSHSACMRTGWRDLANVKSYTWPTLRSNEFLSHHSDSLFRSDCIFRQSWNPLTGRKNFISSA